MGDGGYARIRNNLVQDMIEAHGEQAYSHALAKIVEYQDKGDDFSVKIWKDILNDLDGHFKGEGQ
jgi:hypothetical protein